MLARNQKRLPILIDKFINTIIYYINIKQTNNNLKEAEKQNKRSIHVNAFRRFEK